VTNFSKKNVKFIQKSNENQIKLLKKQQVFKVMFVDFHMNSPE